MAELDERSEAHPNPRLLRYVFSSEEGPKRSFIVTDCGEHLNIGAIIHGERAAAANLDRQQVEELRSACEEWLSKNRNGHGA